MPLASLRFSFPFDAGPFVWLLLVLAFLALVFVVERALFRSPPTSSKASAITCAPAVRSKRWPPAKNPPDQSHAS